MIFIENNELSLKSIVSYEKFVQMFNSYREKEPILDINRSYLFARKLYNTIVTDFPDENAEKLVYGMKRVILVTIEKYFLERNKTYAFNLKRVKLG